MSKNKNYVVGIYDDRRMSQNLSQADKNKEITEFFTGFYYFGPIIVKESINDVLDEALTHDVDYCIVQSVGHIIKDSQFFRFIEKWIEKQDFFITGHIMDKNKKNLNNPEGKEGYYGLHKQCMLVNLKYYKKFDKPVFGNKNSGEEFVVKANRHAKDIHDDYTPLSLKPTKDLTTCTPLVDGWNFINTSLANGLTVYNFHPKIREFKQYIYPTASAAELEHQLSWITTNMVNYAQNRVFFWNTENYSDLKYSSNKKPIKKLYAVASSFKPNMILNYYGFTDDCEVIYYDYSKPALAFKKVLIKEWNGEDYPRFLKYAQQKYKIDEVGGWTTASLTRKQLWEREISWWGSEKTIKEHWGRYRNLKHSYIHCDICETPEKITSQITPDNESVIWWSNAFDVDGVQCFRGISGAKYCYETWLNQLKNKNPDIWILGRDYLGRHVRGSRLKEYIDAYNCQN